MNSVANMSAGPLVVETIVTFCLAALLLNKYGNWRRQHVIVSISVLIAWYFSFLIAFILPLDVSLTAYRQCVREEEAFSRSLQTTTNWTTGPNVTSAPVEPPGHPNKTNACQVPWSHIPDHVLPELWRVVYWTSQSLTWIILPMMQSYTRAGDFTVIGKLKSALIDNAIYYGSYLLIVGILLIYIAVTPGLDLNGPKLKIICVTASNTWGLCLLVMLLGYGLVELPRSCWNSAKRGFMLNYTYFKASKLSLEKSEAEEALEDALEDLQKSSGSIRGPNPLRKHLDTILQKVPEEMSSYVACRNTDDNSINPTETPTEASLIRLHRQVIKSLQTHHRTQTQWAALMDHVLELEDIAHNEVSRDRNFKRTFQIYRPAWQNLICNPMIEWYWKCMFRGWVLRVLSIILMVFSIFVVWSEVTFFIKSPTISLFAVFINLAKKNYDYVYIEIVSCVTIAYMCTAAYYTIFKIRVLNYYYLAPRHQTDEYSLIFSGMLLCRLTPPMCLNFLGLIHLDSHITSNKNISETSYTSIMGHMDVISFIANGFNIYFPIGILLLCLATYFNLGARLLTAVGFEQFMGDGDITTDLVEEGKELVKREKRKRQRLADGELRRRNVQFGGSSLYRRQDQENEDDDDNDTNRAQRRSANLPRTDFTENDRAELLRDIDPVDYTTGRDGNVEHSKQTSTTRRPLNDYRVNRYQSSRESDRSTFDPQPPRSSLSNYPPRRIFDDV